MKVELLRIGCGILLEEGRKAIDEVRILRMKTQLIPALFALI